MQKGLIIFGAIVFASVTFLACQSNQADGKNNNGAEADKELHMKAEEGLREANDMFYAALNAMFTGDLEPMNAIWAHDEQVTDMGPFGGRLTGWEAIGDEFKKEAGMKLGGKVICKDLHIYTGTDMGYTVCTEEGENMSADGKSVLVRFRATNIFQLKGGHWKIIHHHTDLSPQLQEATSPDVK